MRILILEDDINRISQFQERIKDINCQYFFVAHAQDAITLLKRYKFNLIFLDHDLNGKQMDYDEDDCGTLVAKHLRDNPQEEATIVVHSLNFPAAQRMINIMPSAVHIPFIWQNTVFNSSFILR